MKRTFTVFAIALFLVAANACEPSGNAGREGTTPDSTTVVKDDRGAGAEAGVRYSYRLSGGQSWNYKAQTTYNITMHPDTPEEEEISWTVTSRQKNSVTEIDKEGAAQIAVTWLSLGVDYAGPEGEWSYQSDAPGTRETAMGYERFAGNRIMIRLAPETGQVLSVQGAEPFFGGADDAGRRMRELIADAYYIYPDGPVEIGGKWERKAMLSAGLNLQYLHTFELEKRMNDQGFIKVGSAVSPAPLKVPSQIGDRWATFDLEGTRTDHINVNDADGGLLSRVSSQQLEGEMHVRDCEDCEAGTVPVRIETNSVIEVSK